MLIIELIGIQFIAGTTRRRRLYAIRFVPDPRPRPPVIGCGKCPKTNGERWG